MTCAPSFSIRPAIDAHDIAIARALLLEYARSIGVDLAYQGFVAELAALPGAYAPPRGALLLVAGSAGGAAGCAALRPLAEEGACEMKRLFVAPAARGRGLARLLVHAIVADAVRLGYRTLRLDTLPSMVAAAALYAAEGFIETAPYYATPIAGTRFFARPLA